MIHFAECCLNCFFWVGGGQGENRGEEKISGVLFLLTKHFFSAMMHYAQLFSSLLCFRLPGNILITAMCRANLMPELMHFRLLWIMSKKYFTRRLIMFTNNSSKLLDLSGLWFLCQNHNSILCVEAIDEDGRQESEAPWSPPGGEPQCRSQPLLPNDITLAPNDITTQRSL